MVKVFFDVETTGVNYRMNSIIQLAGIIEVDEKVVETFNFLVRPHAKAVIEDKALQVNKRTREEIAGFPEMRTVHAQFKKLICKYVNPYDKTDRAFLVGFNNRFFDDPFLRKFFELCGDEFFNGLFWGDSLDVLCLASEYLSDRRARMPTFKLKRVAQELGLHVAPEALHDAPYDVTLTRQIYRVVTGREEENIF